jgi:DNA-binding NtrC family response regulator
MTQSHDLNPLKILVVDDEADFLDTLLKRLRKRGIEACGFLNGEEALPFLRRNPQDVVLLDMKIPGGLDGLAIFREIKTILPRACVIFLTGHATLESSNEGMKMGAADYLVKPVNIDDLLKKIAVATGKSGGAWSADSSSP